MQRAQYRAQYAFARRRPSFVGPALLILTGVVALLLETGSLQPSSFWPFYAKWWPAILILVGVGLLGEYFLDLAGDRNGMQLQRRRSLGGIFWLVVGLSLAGFSSHAALHFSPFGQEFSDAFGERNWLEMMGAEHDQDLTLQQAVSGRGTLTIENSRGDVQVAAEEDAGARQIVVAAHQIVHSNSDSTARHELEETRPTLSVNGDDASLTVPSRDGSSVTLKVTMPAGMALIMKTAHGDVALSGIRRDVDVTAAHGDVVADSLGAAAHLRMDHGDVIVRNVAGDVTIDGHADDISISGVKGRSTLNGDFFGDTQVEGGGAPVHFHSSRTELDVPRLGGDLNIDKDDLRLVKPAGGMRLVTRSKNVEITDLSGDAHIDDSNDDVNVTTAMPLGNLEIRDHTGGVVVTVPPAGSFTVHASADDSDELTNDFGLAVASGSGRKTLSGQVGRGGPHLELDTDHGDLTLRRGGWHVDAPEAPEAPESPDRMEVPGAPGPPPPPPGHGHGPGQRLHSTGVPPEPSVQ
jgi:hypothetical protein